MTLFFVPLPDNLSAYTEHKDCTIVAGSTDEAIAIWEGRADAVTYIFPDSVWLISEQCAQMWLRGEHKP